MITITKRFAEDGRNPEQEDYTDEEFQRLPIEPWLKEITRHDDFVSYHLIYLTDETIVQKIA
jgi:hypothetical protein